MKFNNFLSLLMIAFLIGAMGCKEDIPPIGEPGSKLDGINGTWALETVIQLDQLTAKFENSLDVSDAYVGDNPTTITFNSADFTYSVQEGDSPNFMPQSGSWSFVNDENPEWSNDFPERIELSSGAEIINIPLLATVRPTDEYLKIQYDRSCNGNNNVSYQYYFKRQ